MLVKRTSPFSGITRERELDITPEQWTQYTKGEGLIQNIFHNLSASDREFIITGITDDEWNDTFKEESE